MKTCDKLFLCILWIILILKYFNKLIKKKNGIEIITYFIL